MCRTALRKGRCMCVVRSHEGLCIKPSSNSDETDQCFQQVKDPLPVFYACLPSPSMTNIQLLIWCTSTLPASTHRQTQNTPQCPLPEIPYVQLVDADVCPVVHSGHWVLPPAWGLQGRAVHVHQQGAFTIGWTHSVNTQSSTYNTRPSLGFRVCKTQSAASAEMMILSQFCAGHCASPVVQRE